VYQAHTPFKASSPADTRLLVGGFYILSVPQAGVIYKDLF
jgi:hypothetical protein